MAGIKQTCAQSDEMCFEFPNASCEDMDDVISLENSSVSHCAVSGSEIEEVPYPEVEKYDVPGPESESGEPVSGEFGESHISRIPDGGDRSGSGGDGSEEEAAAAAMTVQNDLSWVEGGDEGWGFSFGGAKDKKTKKNRLADVSLNPEPTAEAEPPKDDDSWGGWGTTTKKKDKKGALDDK
ncbi:hypothetical protein DM02DRAFT_664541 [Periconia macrospinosa]|uniref:Uncharacterized protein n=1 Tax=Periconia macrospinosa TaxID=97972 RepID=A0A2V1CZY2_9PLEO|nr:hypothetical protein DM02DRAFT_664541 [Periconia macrospinosa]